MEGEHRLALPNGTRVGSYVVRSILGEGGFGITYLAEHAVLARRVALKELLPVDLATRGTGGEVSARSTRQEGDLAWAKDRFLEEARILARFRHPAIVSVHDVFEGNGTAYMATGYDEGEDLAHWLDGKGGPPAEGDVLVLLDELLGGLEEVHAVGLLHRDVKPANIYLKRAGGAMLLDFGSARQSVSSRSRPITSIVTPGYAPFEQYHEDGNQGPWTDLYALGGVVYRMLTGERPPEATKRERRDPMTPLAERLRGRYSAGLLEAADWALRVEEEERPQSVAQWRDALPGLSARDTTVAGLSAPPSTEREGDSTTIKPDVVTKENLSKMAPLRDKTPLRAGPGGNFPKRRWKYCLLGFLFFNFSMFVSVVGYFGLDQAMVTTSLLGVTFFAVIYLPLFTLARKLILAPWSLLLTILVFGALGVLPMVGFIVFSGLAVGWGSIDIGFVWDWRSTSFLLGSVSVGFFWHRFIEEVAPQGEKRGAENPGSAATRNYMLAGFLIFTLFIVYLCYLIPHPILILPQ